MKVVSLGDFVRQCRKCTPVVFEFDSGEQLSPENDSPARVVSRYSGISYMLNPNRLCLKNESGSICFNCVEEIRYEESDTDAGCILSIVCSSYNNIGKTISYTVLADKKIFM